VLFTKNHIDSEIFQLIFQHTRDSIAITVNGIHVLVNKAYADLFKYKSEDDLMGTSIEQLVAPEYSRAVMTYSNNRFLGKDAPSCYETRGLRKDGTLFDMEIQTSTYSKNETNHTLVIIRDISEMKRNHRSLSMITQCHQIQLRAKDEGDFIASICQMVKDTGGYDDVRISFEKADIDNKEESSSTISLPLVIEDETIGTIFIYSNEKNAFNNMHDSLENLTDDISYCINSIRMKKIQRNLENQLLQAQKMEILGTLAGGIAHDFNNIMTPIMGYAEMTLAHMSNDDPLYKYNEQILAGAVRARELVKQILTFSHKENRIKEPIRISEVVLDALKLMSSIIPKTISIKKIINRSCGKILADSAQIHQIIANLCTNSFQAMEKKGGTLTVELKRTTVDEKLKSKHPKLIIGQYVELIIGDTGPGMDRETRNRIFEPFYTTKPVDKGTGLGLSVVHGIVKNHKGTIIVESEPDQGTKFRIFLPVFKEKSAKISKKVMSGNNSKQTILLLDDEQNFTELLKIILTDSGYEVESYISAKSAYSQFKTNPEIYSLVIADIFMPDMNGIDFIKEIKKIRDDLPSILITGNDENLTEREKRQLNIKQIIYKPIFKNDLLAAVSENILRSDYENT